MEQQMTKALSIFLGACIVLFGIILGLQTYHDTEYSRLNPATQDHRFVIVVCSYNNKEIYTKNLDSIFCQDYTNYHVVYVDDNSPDGTYDAVKEYLETHATYKDKITLIKNPVNTRQLRNTYYAVHNFSNDDDIIIILDGDDWFAHSKVLSVLNTIYQDPYIWMTCGNYIQDKGYLLVPNYTPPHAYDTSVLRSAYTTPPPHLRSFYSWLFKQIPLEDLVSEGAFIPMAADMAYLFPMLEMAKDHYYPIQQALYMYNTTGALNCYHNQKSKDLQAKYSKFILQKPPYKALEKPIVGKAIEENFDKNGFSEEEYVALSKVMADTKASVLTIAEIKNKLDIKPEHSTYLYDNFWTYQLGWQPQIPYEYEVIKHIITTQSDETLKKVIGTASRTMPITDNASLEKKVGLLWLRRAR